MTLPDDELARRIAARDEAAFAALFNRHRDAVLRHVVRIVRDRSAADDLVQEVFLRVWNRADQWKGNGPFKAWVFRTATNLALNHLRSRKRRKEEPLERPALREAEDEEDIVPGWMADASRPGADVVLEQAEQHRALRRLVDELSEEKREVFRMVYDDEMAIRDVAQQLRIAEGTVKSRLHHGRKAIARKWERMENGREDS